MTTQSTRVWKSTDFPTCLQKVKVGREKQVKERDYLQAGMYPIIDQGQSVVAGYTNDASKIVSDIQPFIIFGDHTRVVKYVDFPIALGADGTKVIKPKEDFDTKFFYYAILNLDIPSRGYNRHYTILKERKIAHPNLPEQKAIARALTTVQDAITEQERLIEKLKELKRSMMSHLFTHGTKGEKTKKTEIGEVPASWHVIPLGEALLLAQYGLSKKGSEAGRYPVLRMTNQRDGYIHLDNLQYVELSPTELKKFEVRKDDIIFNRTNSIDLVGRTAIYKQEKENVVFASYLIRLKVDTNTLLPDFLNCYFNTEDTQRRLKSIATRGVSQSNISATRLATLMIPLPSCAEQQGIVSISQSIDKKIEAIYSKRLVYERLFKTLLHELMSGERRMQNI